MALKAIGYINMKEGEYKAMTWRSEVQLWIAVGWATLTYGCELAPWGVQQEMTRVEITWLRTALMVSDRATSEGLYWLVGWTPAMYRV